VTFTNASTGGDAPLSYLWEVTDIFGVNNGSTTEENPVKTLFHYDGADPYYYVNVRLTVTDADGDSSVMYKANFVKIYNSMFWFPKRACSNVTPEFTASPVTGNAPLTVSFTNTTTGYTPPFIYEWDFDNDGVVDSTEANPVHTYNWAGTYSVKLKGTDPYGRTGTTIKTDYITVETMGYLSTGHEHTLFINPGGTPYAWGHNDQGQLGNGTTDDKEIPYRVGADSDWMSVYAGWKHSIALKNNGTLWAWGDNDYGQLGDGTTTDRLSPVQIGSDTDWVAVAAGGAHNLALKSDGTLWAWGLNSNGQIGDGTTTTRLSPVQIGSDTDWLSISGGWEHSAAIKTDGSLYTWGWNDQGQLGDGTIINKYSPVKIGANDWERVSTGWKHSIAIKDNGTLWAWGDNDYVQLGDETITDRLSPVQIGSAVDWYLISAGGAHNLALKTDGSLWAWGGNWHGQIGDGSTSQRNSPTHIGSDTDWSIISGGWEHSAGVKSDRSLYIWGWNAYGQIGNGTTNDRLAPAVLSVGGTMPTADFSGIPTSGLSPLTVNFTNISTGGDAPFTYQWDFNNDGIIDSTAENPSNVYTGSGVYTVTLKVTDTNGDTSTAIKQNYITSVTGSVPSADFTALLTYGCGMTMWVQFTNTSTGGDGPFTYDWDFDVTHASYMNPHHYTGSVGSPSWYYENEGTGIYIYTVKLTVTDADGDSNTITKNNYITVDGRHFCAPNPVAAFSATPLSGATPLTVNFTDSSLKATGYSGALSYEWDFENDGTVDSTVQNPSHTYNSNGIYTVKLTATQSDGKTDSEIKTNYLTIWTGSNPSADFTASPTTGQIPLTVNFTNTSTGGDAPFTYEWDFNNDGIVDSTAENPSHTYTSTGSYTVKLKVTDTNGDSSTITKPNYITPINGSTPIADFKALPTYGCGESMIVNFTSTTVGGDAPFTYDWDFDVTHVDIMNPYPHHYTGSTGSAAMLYYDEGTGLYLYTVKLTVTDADGDSSTITKNNYITADRRPFCDRFRTWIDGTSYIYKLQEAYTAASTSVKAKNITFSENINFDLNKTIAMEGGYASGYTSVTGKTTINGNVTISSGTVTMENFTIQ
jgi:PKD repeat protein